MKSALWWLLRTVILRIPVIRAFLTRLIVDIDDPHKTPIAVLSRAITDAIPGEADDQIAAELAEMPARAWLETRGRHLLLPTGRTVLSEYEAIRESVRGD